jgi:hypothetical protein
MWSEIVENKSKSSFGEAQVPANRQSLVALRLTMIYSSTRPTT